MKEEACSHQTICTVLPEDLKALTIAALDVQREEEDRHPYHEDFSRIQMPTQHGSYFFIGK